MATNRKIVAVENTREKAEEMAGYCRSAGNDRSQNRHPRIYKRILRAENVSVVVYVVVADPTPECPIRSSAGLRCVKISGHTGRCYADDTWWGDGKPEAAYPPEASSRG